MLVFLLSSGPLDLEAQPLTPHTFFRRAQYHPQPYTPSQISPGYCLVKPYLVLILGVFLLKVGDQKRDANHSFEVPAPKGLAAVLGVVL